MIPKIIVQTYNTTNLPTEIVGAVKSWKVLNKDYKYIFLMTINVENL